MGEDAAAAVRRELKEELSVNVQCGPLLYVAENFFTTGNEQRHEVGLYFAAALPQQSSLLDKTAAHCGVEVHQRLDFQWFSLVGLDEVDLRPAFLKEALRTSSKTVTHVVQRD
jgi:ADP-ribose pyrophosphatase YjhB (NUDIX family)